MENVTKFPVTEEKSDEPNELEVEVSTMDSAALSRIATELIDDRKSGDIATAYNRVHHRHNR